MSNPFNGIKPTRHNDTIFIPLPRSAWTSCGRCECPHCKGAIGFWDTVAVSVDHITGVHDHTWTVHAPELQPK